MWQFFLDYATLIAGFSAAASVYYLAKQIYSSVKQQQVQRAWESLRFYNDPSFMKIRSLASLGFLHTDLSEEDKLFLLYDAEREKIEEKAQAINSNPKFKKLNAKIKYWLDVPDDATISTFHITNIRSTIISYFNYFEIIGLFYSKREIDRILIKDFFEQICPYVFESSKFLIDTKRERYNPDLYRRWEDMNEEIKLPSWRKPTTS